MTGAASTARRWSSARAFDVRDGRSRLWSESPLATGPTMSRTTGSLYVFGGLLGTLMTAVTPDEGQGSRPVMYAAACIATLIGMGLLLWGDHLSTSVYHVFVAAASVLITVAIIASTCGTAAITLSALYAFVACDAAFFFCWIGAAAQVCFAVACAMVSLVMHPATEWWNGLMAAGVAVAIALIVAVLGRMAAEADIDSLTGLLNRRGFDRVLNAEVVRATRTGRAPALVLFDLVRFHQINDHLGIRAGDALLRRIGESWAARLKPGQQLARYGGDTFALMLPDTPEWEAVRVADEFRSAISTASSAGVTSWLPGESASLLVNRADVGLYRAKRDGGNQTVLESAQHYPLSVDRRDPIDAGVFDVRYQPIVGEAAARRAAGVTVRLSWTAPARPMQMPDGVLRVTEESDVVADLDLLALRRACEDAARLRSVFGELNLRLAVHADARELAGPGYAAEVIRILADTGWPASDLTIEVPDDPASNVMLDNVRRLQEVGVRVPIADFARTDVRGRTGQSTAGSYTAAIESATAPPLSGVVATLSSPLDLEVLSRRAEDEPEAAVLTDLGFALAEGYRVTGGEPPIQTGGEPPIQAGGEPPLGDEPPESDGGLAGESS